MREEIEALIIKVKYLRGQAFNERQEEVHTQLGRVMSNLIRAREALNENYKTT